MSIPLSGPGPYLDGILRLAVAGPGEKEDGPVTLGTPLDVSCSQCGRAMRALVDMDLQDPRLAFVLNGMSGQSDAPPSRLRIPACEQCTGEWFIYTDVNLLGDARNARVRPKPRQEMRNPFTREIEFLRGSDERVPANPNENWDRVAVRVAMPTKYDGNSTDLGVGGTIFACQEWHWPACIRCEELMTYVATVRYELNPMCYYGFWCRRCGVATSYCDVD